MPTFKMPVLELRITIFLSFKDLMSSTMVLINLEAKVA